MERYRIGLMVGNKSIDYVHSIRMGIQNTLEEAGHTLIAIADLIPFHSRINTTSYFRVAFEVAARLDLDAIIVPAGIISGYLTSNQATLAEFLSILDPEKTLVIERDIPGYRCVHKDNKPGMHECMRHLIEDCGFKRIAWIAGPKSSSGAREREEIFFEEMEAHGLDVPSSMLGRGDFSGECGDSIERIIDDNHDVEAIACACDLIAHSVYRIMRKRKLVVGTDIAVTGFDDHEMSSHMDPPLSTVHITGYDLGCMAAREAIRICQGKPQEESVLSSTFIARGSCGEDSRGLVDEFKAMLKSGPICTDIIVQILVECTLVMAGRRVTESFTNAMSVFLNHVFEGFVRHEKSRSHTDQLLSSQELALLFNQEYRNQLSLEGFQSCAIALLQALGEVLPPEESSWIIAQISNLLLGIGRMLNVQMQENKVDMSRREWTAFHITDDALHASTSDPTDAYQRILGEFANLGVRKADLYLLPEPVPFIGARSFALSDTLLPIGHLSDKSVQVAHDEGPVALPNVLGKVIPRYGSAAVYTVGGIMAGDELMGVAVIDAGTLDDDGQLIAFLNLGVALKHMQMIANERESNEILSQSNMMLERQSHYDELTGILNRRGFMSKVSRIMNNHKGEIGALFYLDLDGLKYINDTFGHDAGDEAIRQTTRVLSACMPPDTVLGRQGGDEFIAFTLVDSGSTMTALGRAVDAGMATFNATHSYPYDISISYGGVRMDIDDDSFAKITNYMIQADERLYEMKKRRGSKRASRSSIVV
ncbi:MAG: GGDEF domain-containing protein [Atopobiaceae bacterium]|nr:GGDEF domain-containing protein [Atopobiaceae bacterium]